MPIAGEVAAGTNANPTDSVPGTAPVGSHGRVIDPHRAPSVTSHGVRPAPHVPVPHAPCSHFVPAEHGVALHAGATQIRIEPQRVAFTDAAGYAQTIPADHVIVAKGASGDLTFAEQLRSAGFSVQLVGDCRGVGYIEGAMRSAAEAAAAIDAAA